MNWGTHGGTGDNMVRVMGDAWRYWGQYTEDAGIRMAVLGTIWWEYGGMRGDTGEQYGGCTRGRLAVLGCPSDPWNNSEGVLGHPLAPLTN